MHRTALLLASILCASLAACEPAQPADNPENAAPGAQPGERTGALHAKIIGEWRAAPPARERRLLALARAALADPPDTAGFEKTRPTAEEREHYSNILRLRKEEPNSRLLADLRGRVAELDAIRMTFSADQLVSSTANGTVVDRYTAEAEVGNQLIVHIEGKGSGPSQRAILELLDDDHLILRQGLHEVPFYRKGASPEMPEAPSSFALGDPSGGAGDAPGNAGDAPSAGASGPPAKTGDAEFDRCVADYFACADQMPPESQEAMADSLKLVRLRMQQVAKDPEDRKNFTPTCKNTVQLLKSSGLCR